MSSPALLAVAHGSRHQAAAQTIAALADQVSRLAPVIDIRIAFVQHAQPSLAEGLADVGPNVVVVPLLLSTGYHLTSDVNAAAAKAGVTGARVTGPLGPDKLLVTALASRLTEAGVPTGTAIVLAAAGSSDPVATTEAARQAELLADGLGVPVVAAFAATGRPTVAEAVAGLRSRTGGPVAVASYLLAPGHFQDRLADSGADWVTAPLGDHPAVAGLIIDRYRRSGR